MKQLSILKPYVHKTVLSNEVMEKVSYLKIPTTLDVQSLKADVKLGASQFAELDKLIEKENEPKYILIKACNIEQGYLAVTYLAAGFNKKNDIAQLPEEEVLEEADTDIEEWVESPFKIPLIMRSELEQTMNPNFGNDIFSMGGLSMQSNRMGIIHTPYWMNCTQDSVCVVLNAGTRFGNAGFSTGFMGLSSGFGGNGFENTDYLMEGLNHFRRNDKIYILNVEPHRWDDDDDYDRDAENIDNSNEDDEDYYMVDSAREECNHLVLSLSADEVFVNLKKETEKTYYKLLFRGNLAVKNISVKKGFSYDRLLNIVMAMLDQDKCKLIESIVNYAVKDWKAERPIGNEDFNFMDRFCRTVHMASNERGKKRKTAKEKMMQELIGMEDVKNQVLNVVNVLKYNRIRSQMGILGGKYHNVHVMLGAPGTAKTTVAQLMGQILVEEHLLADNRFTCVNGAELKGMYVGHSAPKTKALFENYDVIVIDEAYSLVGDGGENDSFSKEALAQLIIELENHSTDKLVIFAGYGGKKITDKNNKMKDFLDANPGIKSRITSTIYFDSYSPDEMVQIFFKIAENCHYRPDKNVKEILYAYFQKRVLDDNFGNGREARSLLETAVIHTASRVLAQNRKTYTKAEMQTITYEDVKKAIEQSEYADSIQNAGKMSKSIGFWTP